MSPVKMSVDLEKLKAPKPVAAGWYKLKFKGFRPKLAKNKDGVNFNAELEVIEAKPEENGTKVYMTLSTKFAVAIQDFCHGLGYPLTPTGELPGEWIFDPKEPENVEKAQYKGPLLGRSGKAELVVTQYQGNDKNEVKQFVCAIDGCATKHPEIKHSTSLVGNR